MRMRSAPGWAWIGVAAVLSSGLHAATARPRLAGAVAYTEWQTLTRRDGLPDDRILALRRDGERLWIGTERGLALLDGSTLTRWTRRDGLPHDLVSAIEVDPRTADVWLGTLGGGVIRLSAGRFDRFDQTDSGLAGNLVFDLAVQEGRVWAATNAGLSRYDPVADEWELYFERRLDRPETVVTSLAVLGRELWAAELLEGVARFDRTLDGEVGPIPAAGFGIDVLRLAAADDALWVATTERLVRRVAGGASIAAAWPPAMAPAGALRCLSAGSGEQAWLGTHEGLWGALDPAAGLWVRYAREDAAGRGFATVFRDGAPERTERMATIFPDNRVRAIATSADGLWVGTASGLALGRSAGTAPLAIRPADTAMPPPVVPREPGPVPVSVFARVDRSVTLPWALAGPAPRIPAADLHAARHAVDHVNEKTTPAAPGVRLVNGLPSFSNYGWGQPEDEFAAHSFRDRIAGSVGYVPPIRRASMGVALLTEVPLVNLSTDPPSDAERLNPWVFRCPINDYAHHARVLDHAIDALGCRRIAVVRTGGALAALHLDWWVRRAAERGVQVVAELAWDPQDPAAVAEVVSRIEASRADAVLTWSEAEPAAKLLHALRRAGLEPVFVGGDGIVSARFAALAGNRPGAILAPSPCNHRRDRASLWRWMEASVRPSTMALLTYDGMRHLLDAVLAAGNDRDAVRESLRETNQGGVVLLDGDLWNRIDVAKRP